MTHSNPRLLKRVVQRLSTRNSGFFVHVDKKVDQSEFLKASGPNVTFLPERVPVYWGDYSQVEATLLLIREALTSKVHYDYLVQLNASDYPIRSAQYIETYFVKNYGAEFIALVKVPNNDAGKPIERINTIRYEHRHFVRARIIRALGKIGLDQRDHRRFLGGLDPYAGNGWWALSREACSYIDTFSRCNPEFVKFFRHTVVPHESFFHTILGNSDFAPKIQRHLHYEDWSHGGPSPSVLSSEHINQLELQGEVFVDDMWGKCELLFARKFSDENISLIDRVDAMIERKEGYIT